MGAYEKFEEWKKALEGMKLFLKLDKKNGFCLYYLRFLKIGLSLEATIILSSLINWQGKQIDVDTFYVYKTISDMEEETGLSRYKQDKGVSQLKYYKFIEVINRGVPRKRYFLLRIEPIFTALVSDTKLPEVNMFNLFRK